MQLSVTWWVQLEYCTALYWCHPGQNTYHTEHWRIRDFRLGGRSSAEGVSIEAPQWRRGLSPGNFWIFFASEGCILRAFCHMIRSTVHNARINKVKACKKLRYRHQTVQSHQVVLVALVCLFVFVSRIRLTRKVMNGFWWNFLERCGVPQEEVIRFWDQFAPIIPRRLSTM